MGSDLHGDGRGACINDSLADDHLRAVLSKLSDEKDKNVFGLVCKRWLCLQSAERRRLCARAGPHMLKRMASRFTNLRELDLSQSISRSFFPGVSDSDLAVIASSFSALRVLNLRNCKSITDKGITAIGSGLPSAQFLDVSYCRKLTDSGLSSVAMGCHELRALHVVGCRLITDALLRVLSMNSRSLEELGLEGCTNLTDNGLKVLVEGCKKLKYLNLDKCSKIGNAGIKAVSEVCSSSLLTMRLLDCYKVGDASIASLAKYCKNLETLTIGGCRAISDESLKSLAYACSSSLKVLRVDWCLNISDSSLDSILFLCRELEVLDISCCEEITDAAFFAAGNEGRKLGLRILKLRNCPKITVDGICQVVRTCSALEYLDLRACPHVTEASCNEAGVRFPSHCKVNFTGSIAEPEVCCYSEKFE